MDRKIADIVSPILQIARLNRCEYRNVPLHGQFHDRSQAVTFGFRFAEPVEHEDVRWLLKSPDRSPGYICQSLRIQPATCCRRAERLHDAEPLSRLDILK